MGSEAKLITINGGYGVIKWNSLWNDVTSPFVSRNQETARKRRQIDSSRLEVNQVPPRNVKSSLRVLN
jgi:hypothetical protein